MFKREEKKPYFKLLNLKKFRELLIDLQPYLLKVAPAQIQMGKLTQRANVDDQLKVTAKIFDDIIFKQTDAVYQIISKAYQIQLADVEELVADDLFEKYTNFVNDPIVGGFLLQAYYAKKD